MAIVLNATQQGQRLIPRPSLYYAMSGTASEISEDFEAYLIILPPATKQSIIMWVSSQIQSVNVGNIEYNNCLLDFLNAELSAECSSYPFVDAQLTQLDNLQANLTQAVVGQSPEAPELGMLTSDLQIGMQQMVSQRLALSYQEQQLKAVHSLRLSGRFQNKKDTNTIKELLSWVTVISAYLIA